jgi:redox-sensitive bicupin YhaK (pirin superfamily)
VTFLQTLPAQARDLGGGFMVRRLLPSADRRAVGPFVFFDHFGPIDVPAGAHHDVRPHPHIGLATLTYLFEGAIMHRDSTGVVQRIEPGAVNWMSAGRGIVHSERTPRDLVDRPHRSHGLQLWIALPEALEDSAPSFQHVPAEAIPRVRIDGATARVVAGAAFGAASPVETASPTLAVVLDLDVASGTTIALPPGDATERALYALDHPIEVDGVMVDERTMVVLAPGTTPALAAPRGGRVVLVGGESLGHRFLSWNFVASTRERIRAAEDDWLAQRFARIPGETEFIPLPARHPAPAEDRSVPGAA